MAVKKSSFFVAFLILMSIFYVALTILPGNVHAINLFVGGTGPGNYTTIQDAINASIPGDAIYVYNGTYYEHIIVPHPLSLFGEDNETTIIDAGGSGDVVFVDADWVNISDFTIRNAGPNPNDSGVELNYTQNCYIANSTILSNWYGVYLVYSDGNTILNNNISSSSYSGVRLYGSNNNDIIENSAFLNGWYGIHLTYSDSNNISNNRVWSNDRTGIILEFSIKNNITYNDVFLNVRFGIHLDRSESNNVENNSASYNYRGIYMVSAHYSLVCNNTITNNSGRGLHFGGTSSSVVLYNVLMNNERTDFHLYASHNNVISYNHASDSFQGVHLYDTRNNTLRSNVFVNVGISIHSDVLENWNSHRIDTSNTVNGNPVRYWKNTIGGTIPSGAGQVILANCTGVTVENQNVSDGTKGIQLGFSSNNTISSNLAGGNSYGIYLSSSHSNVVDNNTLPYNEIGVYIHYSNDNLVTNESVSNNTGSALYVVHSKGNIIRDNVASYNDIGVNLFYSVGNTVDNNTMVKNGIFISGNTLDHWNTHIIDTSNTVNGKPVYYWKNVTGGTVPLGAGQVILANCTSVNVTNQDLTDGTGGVTLAYSLYNTITGVEASSNSRNGVFLRYSNNNDIVNNTVSHNGVYGIEIYRSNNNNITNIVASNNFDGLYMHVSDQNIVVNCSFSSNTRRGAFIYHSDSNTFAGNTFQANEENGLHLLLSNGNSVYHNNLLNNLNESYDDSANSWDNGYPSGGNYWGDYNGTDTKNGVNQDLLGSDGIGDIPYNITGGSNQDRYPLMNPLVVLPTVPSEPQNLQATAGTQQISLSWSQPASDGGSPVTNYRIYRGNTSGGEAFLVEVGNVLSYVDGGLKDGQTHYYQVSAVNVAGEGPKSNEADATTTISQTVPSEPQKLLATPGNSLINLTWNTPLFDGNSSITNYRIYRGTTSGGEVFFLEIGDVTTYTNTGLANGQTYYYQISAVNGIGEGPPSIETNATPTNQLPNCSISAPTSEETLSSTYTIIGTASDSDGTVQRMEIKIDDNGWVLATGNVSWSYDLDTTTLPNGIHIIFARSFDGEDYSNETNVTVFVDNPTVPSEEEPGQDWLLIAVAMTTILVTAILLAIYILIRRKKKQKGEGGGSESPPEEDSEIRF
ncbi:MAG: hypothetical protein E3J35_00260 [Methanomassiliicoccales archaeon]|nr:MAG: hypothetical protein E3J35_00260 [Methanomassiliicoccales archaeon]